MTVGPAKRVIEGVINDDMEMFEDANGVPLCGVGVLVSGEKILRWMCLWTLTEHG